MNKKSNKMDCRYCKDRIDDYIGERLGKNDRISFERHLPACPECTRLLHVQKLYDSIINRERNVIPDFFLTARIMARIENTGREKESSLIRILRPSLVAASVAAAVLTGVLIGNIPATAEDTKVPIELTLMNDSQIELVNVLTGE